MYHRTMGEDESRYAARHVAESIRMLLSRASILMVVLLAAPYLYGMLTGGRLDQLAGGDSVAWETIQWTLMVMTVFVIAGLVGVAKCTGGMR